MAELYWWAINEVKSGPASLDKIRELVRNGTIPRTASLWCRSWPEWKALESVAHTLAIPNVQKTTHASIANKSKTGRSPTMTFFIYANGENKGPYTMGQLRKMWAAGTLTGNDLYCENGTEKWSHLSDLEYDLEASPVDTVTHRPSYVPQAVPYELRQRQWSPGVAIVLSFFFPGLGQMYRGKIGRGILWLIFVTIGYLLMILPGLVLHLICLVDASSGDPTRPGDAK